MPSGLPDLYALLEVPEQASADEIRKAYRRLAKKYHPDANQGDPRAAERFKEIGEANSILSDPERRTQYDQARKFGIRPGGGVAGAGREGPAGAGFDFSGLGDFGDLLSSLFDGGRPAGGRRPGTGRDVEVPVTIPLETAARGGNIPVRIPVRAECGPCRGSGAASGTTAIRCPECQGRGSVSLGRGGLAVTRPCPRCRGRGTIPELPCPVCGGEGVTDASRTVEVAIPPGIEAGARLTLRGEGAGGPGGARNGAVHLRIAVAPHRTFRREGLDLEMSVPLNLAQAVLGSTLRVATIEGGRVQLRIPPGTREGTRFRIPGLGVRKGGKTGDQIVRVRVEIPKDLDPEARARMEDFARAAGLRF